MRASLVVVSSIARCSNICKSTIEFPSLVGSACHCVTQGVTAHRATVPMTTYKYDETGVMAACRNFVENFKDGYKKLSNQDKNERGFTIVPKFSTK